MPKTYYDSELTAEQIEAALKAIADVVNPGNNGKVMYIEDGKIKAASASRWSGGAVLEPLSVTANGDYTPPSGTDGFDSVHVAVPSAGNIQSLSVTQNGTYTPPSGVDGYAPVTVNVSGGSTDPTSITTLWESTDYNQNITTIPLSDSANNYNFLLIGCCFTNAVGSFTSFLLPIIGYAIDRYPLAIPNVYVKPPQNSLLAEADCKFRLLIDGNQCLVSEQTYLRPVLIKGVR